MTSRQAVVLYAFAAWTLWVWGTRIWNVFDADNSTGFVVVHVALALVSVAFAVGAIVIVRSVRRAGGSAADEQADRSGAGRAGSLR
jgi:hypothetical protein